MSPRDGRVFTTVITSGNGAIGRFRNVILRVGTFTERSPQRLRRCTDRMALSTQLRSGLRFDAHILCQAPESFRLFTAMRLSQNLREDSLRPALRRAEGACVMSAFESRSKARRKAQLTEFALGLRRGATDTEQILWGAIRGRALGVRFRRQVPIAGLFIGDFVASEVKLVIEVDGSRHVSREAADCRRDAKLQRLGYTVLRLSADLVEHQLPIAVQRIRETVAVLSATP